MLTGRLLVVAALLGAVGVLAPPGVSAHPEGPSCKGWHATIMGSRNAETITGTPGRDVIVARGGNDRINGRAGNDVVCAGRGVDLLLGEEGNDVLVGQAGRDLAYGGAGHDDVVGGGDADQLFGDAGEDALFGGDGGDQLDGGDDVDLLLGGPGDDVLDAGTGEGTISFEFSPEAMTVDLAALSAAGEGTDRLGGEVAHVIGSAHNDSANGDARSNRFDGRAGDDVLRGLDSNDSLTGGAGNDTLDGGGGFDQAFYIESTAPVSADLDAGTASGGGDDGLASIEHLWGSNLADSLRGDESSNSLTGADGDDVIDGRTGNDTLGGGFGNDSLFGGEGDDSLYGGIGERDTSDGGPGSDTCWADDAQTACETSLINGPGAHTWITEPASGANVAASSFSRLAGRSSFGHWGPDIEDVQLSLRVVTPGGCRWWSDRHGKLMARPCALPAAGWFKAVLDDAGNWSYRFFSQLPAGRYELRSRAVNPDEGMAGGRGPYKEDFFDPGRNFIVFTIT